MQPGSMVQVSVVIPTHNRCPSLLRALHALARQTHPAERVEVIVVADGCSDGTADHVRGLATPYRLRLVEQPASGPAAARNAGADCAQGELLVFMDDDIEPQPGFLEAHVRAHAAAGHVVVGYCKPALGPQRGLFREILTGWWEDMFTTMSRPGHVFRYNDLLTGILSLPASLFRQVGGFDTGLRVHEDYELGIRLLAAGARFRYEPRALGLHHEQTELNRALRRKYDEGRADVLIGRRHPDLIPALPLSRCRSPTHVRLAALAFLAPALGDRLAAAGAPLMGMAERYDRRSTWMRLCDLRLGYWYWRGVAAELGGLAALRRFRTGDLSGVGGPVPPCRRLEGRAPEQPPYPA